eukprot:Colp12_sorted_trinity150504_noHs@664
MATDLGLQPPTPRGSRVSRRDSRLSNAVKIVHRVLGSVPDSPDPKVENAMHPLTLTFYDSDLEECYMHFTYETYGPGDRRLLIASHLVFLLFAGNYAIFASPPPSSFNSLLFFLIFAFACVNTLVFFLTKRFVKSYLWKIVYFAWATAPLSIGVLVMDALVKHTWDKQGYVELTEYQSFYPLAILIYSLLLFETTAISPRLQLPSLMIHLAVWGAFSHKLVRPVPYLRIVAFGFLYIVSSWKKQKTKRSTFWCVHNLRHQNLPPRLAHAGVGEEWNFEVERTLRLIMKFQTSQTADACLDGQRENGAFMTLAEASNEDGVDLTDVPSDTFGSYQPTETYKRDEFASPTGTMFLQSISQEPASDSSLRYEDSSAPQANNINRPTIVVESLVPVRISKARRLYKWLKWHLFLGFPNKGQERLFGNFLVARTLRPVRLYLAFNLVLNMMLGYFSYSAFDVEMNTIIYVELPIAGSAMLITFLSTFLLPPRKFPLQRLLLVCQLLNLLASVLTLRASRACLTCFYLQNVQAYAISNIITTVVSTCVAIYLRFHLFAIMYSVGVLCLAMFVGYAYERTWLLMSLLALGLAGRMCYRIEKLMRTQYIIELLYATDLSATPSELNPN